MHVVRWAIGAAVGVVVVAECWSSSFLEQDSHRWAIVAIVAVAILVAECLPDLESALPWPGAATGALLFPLAAIYGCVPETDHLYTIAAVIGVVALLELVTRRARGIIWHAVAATLLLWGAVYGATGRDRAFVGGLFAFWPIVLVGGLTWFRPGLLRAASVTRIAVYVLGATATLIVSRTGALQAGRRPASRDALVAGLVSFVAAVALVLATTRAKPSRRTS